MPTAFTATAASTTTAAGSAGSTTLEGSTLLERLSRRTGLALLAFRRAGERRRSREHLVELHERRREAARLRDERFRDVTLTRLM